ncbi:hypothetical protein GPECTOR_196g335 [Gonium pectorale]|uniref:Uncharacterized protein n=1 Tax=Gonium pectorale TaxID=33097 RepID=A0A150FX06_GONPE|nr:hypothetical protein GPECTOR_196g335 [Gonium pectorale]|eukprot:KXZ42143.1 hypothetical protein GPECTOR_196g335 [Gonium pectorale]
MNLAHHRTPRVVAPQLCPGAHSCGARHVARFISARQLLQTRPAAAVSSYPLVERTESRGSNSNGGREGSSLGAVEGSQQWLAAGVREIVASLGRHGRQPLLQLVFSSSPGGWRHGGGVQHRFQALPVDQSVADNPQSWDSFAAHVRSSGANGLVLVRPIPSPDLHCAYAASAATASQAAACGGGGGLGATGQPSCSAASAYGTGPAASPFAATVSAAHGGRLEGQVGDCCDGAGASSHEPPRHQASSGQQSSPGLGAPASPASSSCPHTDYYGLVVQSNCPSDADGCWVLKVTRSEPGGAAAHMCSCMHFTLTRVCQGQPLAAQLRDAWLARPAVA